MAVRVNAALNGTEQLSELNLQLPNIELMVGSSKTASLQGIKLYLDRRSSGTDTKLDEHIKLKVALAEGQWRLITGLLSGGSASLELDVGYVLEDWSFNLDVEAHDLLHQGFPIIRITSIHQQAIGTLHSKEQEVAWWDAKMQLDTVSGYGPLRAKVDVVGPNNLSTLLRKTGRIKLQVVVPMGMWQILKLWQPKLAQTFIATGMAKTRADTLVFNALLRDGVWYAPAASPAPPASAGQPTTPNLLMR